MPLIGSKYSPWTRRQLWTWTWWLARWTPRCHVAVARTNRSFVCLFVCLFICLFDVYFEVVEGYFSLHYLKINIFLFFFLFFSFFFFFFFFFFSFSFSFLFTNSLSAHLGLNLSRAHFYSQISFLLDLAFHLFLETFFSLYFLGLFLFLLLIPFPWTHTGSRSPWLAAAPTCWACQQFRQIPQIWLLLDTRPASCDQK